jgi:hypothetical protein
MPLPAAAVDPREDEDELKKWILRRFGAPLLVVELPNETLDDCISDAKVWFSAKKGFYISYITRVVPPAAINLPDGADKVIEVNFNVPDPVAGSTSTLGALVASSVGLSMGIGLGAGGIGGGLGTGGGMAGYAQTMQYLEMMDRLASTEFDWSQEPTPPNGLKLHIMGGIGCSVQIRVTYKARTFPVNQLLMRDYDLVRRFALADAKAMLGRIRSKFGSFPGAQGAVELDGQTLLQESQVEMEALNAEIEASGYAGGWVMG